MRWWGFVLVLSFLGGTLEGQTVLPVTAIAYPPYTNADGRTGLAFELMESALSPQYTVRYDVLPSWRAAAEFESGEVPATLYVLDYSKVPGAATVPQLNVRLVFLGRKGSGLTEWKTLSDFKGKTICVLRALVPEQSSIRKALADSGAELIQVGTMEQAFQMVATGRADLLFSVDLTATIVGRALYPTSSPLVELKPEYAALPSGPWFNTSSSLGKDAMVAFRKGLLRILSDGTAAKIAARYYEPAQIARALDVAP